jgi:hypothetical protein
MGLRIGVFFAAAIIATLSSGAGAQSVTGRVFDATDSLTVSGAQVRVGAERVIRTDGRGNYAVNLATGRYELVVRMLGYGMYYDSVEVRGDESVARDFYLVRIPRLLSTMVVHGRSVRVPSGFEDVYQRGATGAGVLVTREQIDSINPRDVAGLLHQVPFVHVNAHAGASNALSTSRCRQMLGGSVASGRMVRVFLNGTAISNPTAVDEILRRMTPSSIQAVEVYNGVTTIPFIYQPACGVVATWTRKG